MSVWVSGFVRVLHPNMVWPRLCPLDRFLRDGFGLSYWFHTTFGRLVPCFGLALTPMLLPPPRFAWPLAFSLQEDWNIRMGFGLCMRTLSIYWLFVVVGFGYALSRFAFDTGFDFRTGFGALNPLFLGWVRRTCCSHHQRFAWPSRVFPSRGLGCPYVLWALYDMRTLATCCSCGVRLPYALPIVSFETGLHGRIGLYYFGTLSPLALGGRRTCSKVPFPSRLFAVHRAFHRWNGGGEGFGCTWSK